MTYAITCDYCGELIDRGDDLTQMVTVEARGDKGGPKRSRWKSGYVGHYHGQPCWRTVFEAIKGIHEPDDGLESIPTATPAQLAELRAGDHAGESPLDHEPLFEEVYNARCGQAFPRKRRGTPSFAGVSPYHVFDAGIRTVGDLRRAIKEGTILEVTNVGPRTAARIEAELANFLASKAVTA
jgi:hypothetical protein